MKLYITRKKQALHFFLKTSGLSIFLKFSDMPRRSPLTAARLMDIMYAKTTVEMVFNIMMAYVTKLDASTAPIGRIIMNFSVTTQVLLLILVVR